MAHLVAGRYAYSSIIMTHCVRKSICDSSLNVHLNILLVLSFICKVGRMTFDLVCEKKREKFVVPVLRESLLDCLLLRTMFLKLCIQKVYLYYCLLLKNLLA